jgi:small subunit ribosomal protein S3
LGIKVWICKGEVYGKRDLSPNIGMNAGGGNKQQGGNKGGNDRGDQRQAPKFNKGNKKKK